MCRGPAASCTASGLGLLHRSLFCGCSESSLVEESSVVLRFKERVQRVDVTKLILL